MPTPCPGADDRFVIAAVPGGPDQLVSGEVDGVTLTLTARGKVVESTGSIREVDTNVRGLVALQKRAAIVFGGPQDVEWAIVDDDVVMLQSRPITATGTDTEATGPIFGPGPVAETFPDALAPLELDLWVEPMKDAIREVLRISGGAAAKKLAASPVIVIEVNGHVAADLATARRREADRCAFVVRPHRSTAPGAATQGRVVGRSVARCAARPGTRSCRRDRRHARRGPRPRGSLRPAAHRVCSTARVQALRSVYGHEMLAGQLLDEESVPVTRRGRRVARSSPTSATWT